MTIELQNIRAELGISFMHVTGNEFEALAMGQKMLKKLEDHFWITSLGGVTYWILFQYVGNIFFNRSLSFSDYEIH